MLRPRLNWFAMHGMVRFLNRYLFSGSRVIVREKKLSVIFVAFLCTKNGRYEICLSFHDCMLYTILYSYKPICPVINYQRYEHILYLYQYSQILRMARTKCILFQPMFQYEFAATYCSAYKYDIISLYAMYTVSMDHYCEVLIKKQNV